MVADLLTVDVNIRHLVGSADMENHPAPVEAFRQGQLFPVAQVGALGEVAVDTGQGCFRAEGHPDGQVIFLRQPAFLLGGKVPVSVQIEPVIPLHLGTGIDVPGLDFRVVFQVFSLRSP